MSTAVSRVEVRGHLECQHRRCAIRPQGDRTRGRVEAVARDDPGDDAVAGGPVGDHPHGDLAREQIAVEGDRGRERTRRDAPAGDRHLDRQLLRRASRLGLHHDRRNQQLLGRQTAVEELPRAASAEHGEAARHDQVEVRRESCRRQRHAQRARRRSRPLPTQPRRFRLPLPPAGGSIARSGPRPRDIVTKP